MLKAMGDEECRDPAATSAAAAEPGHAGSARPYRRLYIVVPCRHRACARGSAGAVLARKALTKPLCFVLRRSWAEVTVRAERDRGPARARRLDERALLAALGDETLDSSWARLRASLFLLPEFDAEELEVAAPGERDRVLAAAALAAERELDLLGTGPFWLAGQPRGTPTSSGHDVAACVVARARICAARPAERCEGAVGDLAAAVAPARGPGLLARRR